MTWMVHFHLHFRGDGEPSKRDLLPLVVAAAQMIVVNGVLQPCFQRLKNVTSMPLPPGLDIVRFDAGGEGSVLLALVWRPTRKTATLIDFIADDRSIDPLMIPDDFLYPVLEVYTALEAAPEPMPLFPDQVAFFIAEKSMKAGQHIADRLSGYLNMSAAMYQARLKARKELGDLFNQTESQILRMEKRADFMLQILNKYLAEQAASCSLRITFNDGHSFESSFYEPPDEKPNL